MRKIKFRGYGIAEKKWFYGNLIEGNAGRYITDAYYEEGQGDMIRYDPIQTKTIGQFTGLLDNNGKEIYEGDIVNITDGDDILVGHGVVEWLDNWGLWYVDGEGHANNGLFDINWSDYLEVIGNIHDNPELLKNND